MTSHDTHHEPSRPSLFGPAQSGPVLPPADGEGLRMLSGLATNPGSVDFAPEKSRVNVMALIAAAALVVSSVVLWRLNRSEPAPPVLVAAPAVRKVALEPAKLPEPTVSASASVAVIERVAPVNQVTALADLAAGNSIGSPTSTASAPQVDAPRQTAASTAPAPSVAPTAAALAPAMAVAPVAKTSHAATPRAHTGSTTSPSHKAVAVVTPSPDTKAPAALPKASAAAGGPRDSDVDLIAAMVAHLETPGAPKRKTVAPTSTARAKVSHARPTSIKQLVADCKKLGGKEALQCRRQICDGYWGKAQACPAKLAPSKSAKALKAG